MSVIWIVALDEVLEILVLEGIGLESEMLIGSKVVDPQLLGPGILTGGFAVEEQHVGFDSLRVEYARGQTQQSMNIAFMEQFSADCLACAALKEYVVGNYYGSSPIDLQQRTNVLKEFSCLFDVVAQKSAAFCAVLTTCRYPPEGIKKLLLRIS